MTTLRSGLFVLLLVLGAAFVFAAVGTKGTTNSCDATQFPIANLGDGDASYAYKCIDATHATSCDKKTGNVLSANFEIPAAHQLRTVCASGQPVQSAVSSTPASCILQERCKALDEIWSLRLGPLLRSSPEVWDVRSAVHQWAGFGVIWGVKDLPEGISPLVARDYGGLSFDDRTHLPTLVREAEEQDIHPCYAVVVAKHESGGKAEAIQAEANLPVCNSIERPKFMIETVPVCKTELATPEAVRSACLANPDTEFTRYIRPAKGTSDCLDAFLDTKKYRVQLPTPATVCSTGIDTKYRWAMGLGQINILANERSASIGGKSYTHCQLLTPETNAEATAGLLRKKGATKNPTTRDQVAQVFANYGGGQPSENKYQLRTDDFLRCSGLNLP